MKSQCPDAWTFIMQTCKRRLVHVSFRSERRMNTLLYWLCFTLGAIPSCFILSFVLFILLEFISERLNRRRNSGTEVFEWPPEIASQEVLPTCSGIDRTLIASLPLCRFPSLEISNLGRDCPICLSKFEDLDILHLLPKCRHVFHISCIDAWLEMNSTCPLCRQDVTAHDITMFKSPWKLSCSRNRGQSAEARSEQITCSTEADCENGLPCFIADSSNLIKTDDEEHERLLPNREVAGPDKVYRCQRSDTNGVRLVFLNSFTKQPSTIGSYSKGDDDIRIEIDR